MRGRLSLLALEERCVPAGLMPTKLFALSAVGAGAGTSPLVNVYNPSGSLRFSFFAFNPAFRGGVTVTTADVTGDRIDDIIVGAGPGGGPQVNIYNGVNLALVTSYFAFNSTFRGGVFVAAGDLTGDGQAEVVTGVGVGGSSLVGIRYVAANTSGYFYAYSPNFTGGVRVAVGELTGDNCADIVTGAGLGGGPQVNVYDGTNLTLRRSFFAFSPSYTGGVFVAAGDIGGTADSELIVSSGAQVGIVNIFSATGTLQQSFYPFGSSFATGVTVAVADASGTATGSLLVGAGSGAAPLVRRYRPGPTDPVTFFAFSPLILTGVFVG